MIEHSLYDYVVRNRYFAATQLSRFTIDANERSLLRVCTVGICNHRRLYRFQSPACVAGSLRDVSIFFLIASHARCALIVPKRCGSRGVTRCASRSRLRLSIRGSDRGGRKKKHGRFISDGRQLSRTLQSGACVYFFFPLYFFLRVVKLQYTGCCRLLKDPFRLV